MPYIATDIRPRCGACSKLLAEELTWPWRIQCPRCKTTTTHETKQGPGETTVAWVEDTAHPA